MIFLNYLIIRDILYVNIFFKSPILFLNLNHNIKLVYYNLEFFFSKNLSSSLPELPYRIFINMEVVIYVFDISLDRR